MQTRLDFLWFYQHHKNKWNVSEVTSLVHTTQIENTFLYIFGRSSHFKGLSFKIHIPAQSLCSCRYTGKEQEVGYVPDWMRYTSTVKILRQYGNKEDTVFLSEGKTKKLLI